MKKIRILLTGLLLSSAVLGSLSVDAATYSSNGVVNFEKDDTPTPPVDPVDPDPNKPVDPVDPTDPNGPEPGTPGPLSIDYASSFDFGTQKISTQTHTYNAALQKYKNGTPADGPNYVQVTDKTGLYTGWDLTVKQESQFKKGTTDLTGAAMTLNKIKAKSISGSAAPTTSTKVDLNPGDEHSIASAAAGQGKGTWAFHFGENATDAADAVRLTVPGTANAEVGKYTTSLTWKLVAKP